jgi:hypothetical protein
MKVKINNKRNCRKYSNRLKNSLLNDQGVKEEIKKQSRKKIQLARNFGTQQRLC